MRNNNNNKKTQKNMWETFSVIVILLSAIALVSSFTLPNGMSIDVLAASTNSRINDQTPASPQTLVQNLTKANVPVTLPLTKGYVNGFEVFYISTEASDKGLANHLTNVTHSRVSYTPALGNVPPQSLGNIYVFANGIKGLGPLGFQANVADSQPGDSGYSPLWRINNVEWKQGVSPREIKSEADILSAQKNGELTVTPSNKVVNCPFVQWHGGSLKERTDKTLTDMSAYGGGQVLNINPKRMQVTFVGHRGFAPSGSTIYYIATDASAKKLADALGVIFVNKTSSALLSGGSSDLYVFTNGIKGTGPMGYQVSIAASNVGDPAYSPLWRIQVTTWKDPSHAEFLTSLAQITSAAQAGKLSNNIAGVLVNCPIVNANTHV
jgi:hypothetical protein